jgi:hypothetical protein
LTKRSSIKNKAKELEYLDVFSRYAALVKNMRGVVLFSPADDVSEDLKWLVERFRYRVLGVPQSLVERVPGLKKPLVPLAYPSKGVEDFVKFVASSAGLEREVAEAVCLASCYVSPLLALGPGAQKSLRGLAVGEVSSKVEMGVRDWKLHLRIADYSVLDLYEWSTTQAQRLWQKDVDVEELISERVAAVKRDQKRYWRLQRGELEPRTFLVYLDLVQSLHKIGALGSITKHDVDVVSACLAINVSVFVRR